MAQAAHRQLTSTHPMALHPSARPPRAVLELHHDLRQPLNAIRALVAAAETHPEVSDLVRSCLDDIGEEARHLLALCHHVLAARDKAAEGTDPTVSVGHVAKAVAHSCRTVSGATIAVDAQPVLAEVDEVELRRALWNLLENATRAAGPTGRVDLTVRGEGSTVVISVGDSGPGFAQGPKGTASLGLAIVNRLASRHGGRVEVGASQRGGALVSLILPARRDVVRTAPQPA